MERGRSDLYQKLSSHSLKVEVEAFIGVTFFVSESLLACFLRIGTRIVISYKWLSILPCNPNDMK